MTEGRKATCPGCRGQQKNPPCSHPFHRLELIEALRARLMSADVQENESLRSQLAVVRDANRFLTDNCKRLARERDDLRARLTALADEWEIDRYGNDSRAFRARLSCAEDLRAAMLAPIASPQ